MYKICSKCSPWDMISILWRCLLHSAFLRLESKWKYLILHTLAGIVWIMEAHSDWKPPFKWNAGNSMHHRFDVFLQKSLRCAFDGVIVTIHCNAQWNDNIFFPQPVKQSQSFDNHMKDLSADNPNIWWSTQAAFFLSVAHDIFFFTLSLHRAPCARSKMKTLPAATDCLLLLSPMFEDWTLCFFSLYGLFKLISDRFQPPVVNTSGAHWTKLSLARSWGC